MATTYLQAVNDVLRRLRETEVTTVNGNSYSKLIGVLVNDAKRIVEDAYPWNALNQVITVNSIADTSVYSLTGAGTRFKDNYVVNTTYKNYLEYKPYKWFIDNSMVAATGVPNAYTFNGQDTNGDSKVEVYPIPDNNYTLKFYLNIPQKDLTSDAETVTILPHIVTQLAYALAIAERGEDGGLNSSEAYLRYKESLADAISIEASRYPDFGQWSEQ